MDPNVSTDVPADFTPVRLSGAATLAIKFFIFGTLALVLSTAIGFSVYVVIFKKKHRERKAARRAEVTHQIEKGILPRSRHYPIGKVPRIKSSHFQPPGSSTHSRAGSPDLSRSSTRASNRSPPSSPQFPRRSCRVSRAPDSVFEVPQLPKTLGFQNLTKTTTFS